MFRTSVLSLCLLLLVVKNSQPKVKPFLMTDTLHDREKLVYNVVRNQIAERSSGIIGQLMREDLNKINALKNKLGINYINYFNNNNGGILDNGLPLFNIGGILENGLLPFNIDGVADDDFMKYIDYTEDCAECMGFLHYISQHAASNVEGEDVSSIHNFPTHRLLRFFASWLNYGEANGATSMDDDNGAAQHGHEYGEISNTHPSSVHPHIIRCSNYRVTCRTNGESYYSSTTAHPSAAVLLEPPHGPTYASYLCISPSTIKAVVTQHRLIRLLTQRHDNHHLITPVAVWGDVINVYASTAASSWVIHNDDIPPNVTIMRVGPCKKTTHIIPRFVLLPFPAIDGTSDICEVDIYGGWTDKRRYFSAPNMPCVKNGELPPIDINTYSLRLVNSSTEAHQNCANSPTLQHIITSLRIYIFHDLYKLMYHIVSFEDGVETTFIRQRDHAILLWGDYSCTSCSISAQDLVIVDIKQIRFCSYNGRFSTAISQSDCYRSLWNARSIFLSVTGQDDYMGRVSTSRILLVIEDTASLVRRCESTIFCEDCIGLETSRIIQGPTASIYVAHHYDDSSNSLSTLKISHSHHDRSHRCASCFGLGENGSQHDFRQKHPQGYGQLQVSSTALQLAVDTSSVYSGGTPSFDVQSTRFVSDNTSALAFIRYHVSSTISQTYIHATTNSTDFIHRCVMRYFDRVSRNDGGDTLLLDESVLVDMMDTTYLMENSEVIHDDEYVLMTVATSGMNGEPHTLVDMTSNVIPVWINENVFKSTSIWGACLSDVVGQCWKTITSTVVTDGEIMEGLLSSSDDSSVYGEESRDDVDGSSNIALGCNQSNDAVAYFSDIKDEHYGVVDLRSSIPVWHVEADGIQSLFGLELRRAMGMVTLQKINGGVCCLKWLDFIGELQEQYEGLQCNIKSTVETGSNKADEQQVSDENSTQHGCNFAKRMTVTVDDSSLLVLTTETTCAATVNTPTITLLWRLHRLSTQLYSLGMFSFGNYSDFYNNDISYCLTRLRCLYAWTTRLEKYVLGEGIMRPSCASLTIGKTLQEGIKTAENVKFIQNDISPTGNHTSVHLHRTFLSRGASLSNLLSASSICVLLHDLFGCGTIVMNDDKSYATGIAYCGDGNASCHDACDQDTTWGDVDKSSSIVFNTSAAPTAMFCVSSTCITALLRRLIRISTRLFSLEVLIIDSFDSNITNKISCIHCLYTVTTLETAELVSVRCFKRASCTSPVNGERFMCRLDKAIHSYSIQDNDASYGNYSLFDAYWNHKQLMNRRNICADDTASASMQQLMGSASRLPRCKSVIMSTILAKLRDLHLVFGTAELEPRACAARSVMICGIGYCCGDVQHDWWKCLCANLGLLVGLLLLLRRAMGSHTLQIVDSKAGHDTSINLCHYKLSRMYVNALHFFFSKTLVDYTVRERATLRKRWVRWTIRPNLAIRIVLEEGYCKVSIQKDPIQSTNTTNRRGVTEWVRVPVDTDSMSTINTGTFRGIGTQSSSITDRDDNEDHNPYFRKLKSK